MSHEYRFEQTPVAVFEAVVQAIGELEKLGAVDQNTLTISFATKVSGWSWGSQWVAQLTPDGEGTLATASMRAAGSLVAGKAEKKRIDRIWATAAARLPKLQAREASVGHDTHQDAQPWVGQSRMSLGSARMSAETGHKLKEKQVAKWGQLLASQLLPGEEALAMLKCNNMRPGTNGIVVTNFRLGGVSDVDGWSVVFPYDTPFSMTLDPKKETALVRVDDPSRIPASDKLRREDMLFKMVQSEDHQMLETIVGQARAAFDPAVYQATVTEQAALVDDNAARAAAAARGEWPEGTRVRGTKLSSKASSAVLRQCHGEDDNPWLILVSGGGAGVLAAWEDRLAIIKTGALTSFMAGSLGGERTATFHFVDVTGIEFNSGMLNGVLEILTPSYSGGANKDFWRGSASSRNADSNDPWTLSNTLPLAKAEYNLLQGELAELRSRIAKAKQPTVIVQAPSASPEPPAASAAPGMAAQIADLAALHGSGALSDEEFAEAKRRVISGG